MRRAVVLALAAVALGGATALAGLGPVELVDRHGQPFATLWNDEVRYKEDPCDRYFAFVVRAAVKDVLGSEVQAGLTVRTSLDLRVQRAAEKALLTRLPEGTPDENGVLQPQGAIVVLDPRSGDVLALIGGRCQDSFNRAVAAFRQPGSALKPFVYAAALDSGMTAASFVYDGEIALPLPGGKVWQPQNADGRYHRWVSLRYALVHSLNTASIRVLAQVGVDRVLGLLSSLGFSRLGAHDRHLGLSLGAVRDGVAPLEMARAYSVLASGGYLPEVRTVLSITERDGELLYEAPLRRQKVMDPVTAYIVTSMLQEVLTDGTAAGHVHVDIPMAGKTGTSEGDADAWFVGYTPALAAAVWVGFDRRQPLPLGDLPYASLLAVHAWGDFMERLRPTPRSFDGPRGVSTVRIDTRTGLRVPARCNVPASEVRTEFFRKGTEPAAITPRCEDAALS